MISKVRNWINRSSKSGRWGYALVLSLMILFVVIGIASAGGPMRPPGPPMGGMWGRPMPPRPWMPMEPVPRITIIAVVKDQSVTFETSDFPAEQDFTVTMGPIYSRGVHGYEVGTFNSGDGSAQQLSFPIPAELAGQYRIAVRAQTDHARPYFAFNWFYNNTTTGSTAVPLTEETEAPAADPGTGGAEETEAPAETQPPAETETAEPVLEGVVWYWTDFTDAEQGALPIDSPESYTVEFTPEGRVAIKADCNNGNGTFIVDEGSIDIAIGAITLALCAPESLSDQFISYLGDVAVYDFEDGDLLLDLPADSGTLRFSAQAPGEAGTGGAAETETPAEPEAPAETETAPAAATLTGTVWQWTGFTDPVSEPLVVADPAQYTVEFMEDGSVAVKADCNNGNGTYTADEGQGAISITIAAMTRALCAPESLSDQFVEYLNAAAVYSFEEADLLLDLPVDSGTLRFGAAADGTAMAPAAVASTVAVVADSAVQTASAEAEMQTETVPSFKICSVVKDDTVTIVTSDFPAEETFAVKMGPMPAQQPQMRPMPPMMGPGQQHPMRPGGMWGRRMPMPPRVWIPYYDAGTLESGKGGEITATFDIPAELAGTYRISIMLRTEHMYPYLAYNWFYNNTADVCNDSD